MASVAAPLLYLGPARGADKESWGPAVVLSLAAHAAIALLFILSAPKRPEGTGTILTEVNFIEKPVEPVPAPDSAAQAPTASAVVSFSGPAQPSGPARAEPVAAPIIPNAPIMPIGQVGSVGSRKAALAPLPTHADTSAMKKGPIPLPMTGGGVGKGSPIALNTQGVDDIRRRGGGPVIPLTTAGGGGGGSGSIGKPLTSGGGLSEPRKAPIETLKATAVGQDSFGKKNSPFSIEGPLRYRKIKVMQMPPYPRWAEEQGVESTVSYRLWVDPKGKVRPDKVYLEKTSGYSELDKLAKDALVKFVFVPLPDDQPPEDEWGVATFRFELKK